jgi:replicative DNA helicase
MLWQNIQHMPGVTEQEKIPPHNLDAEMSLLGAVLLDKETMPRIADMLTSADFYKYAHGQIYEILVELYSHNEPIDILTVSSRLEEKSLLESIGGRSYLVKLTNGVPSTLHVQQYAAIVERKATLRKLLSASHEIASLAYGEEDNDVDMIVDRAQQQIYTVGQKNLSKTFTPIRNILNDAFERIDELHREKGKLRGVASGFKELDSLLSGFQKSDLIILAARPSVGKSSLALDFARHAAVRVGAPVGFFSLEMSKEQLVDRLLCSESGVNLWKLRTGNLSDRPDSDDFPRIGQAMGVLSEAKIFFDDTPGATVMQIRSKARRLQSEHGLGLIIIDYLQLMEAHTNKNANNRVQEVSEMSRNLKGIARELNVPVIALSQLSRAVEQTKPAIPKLAHLRESGSIEQDADVVMFIYRKAADRNYRLEDIPPDERNIGEIHIAKHRNGPTGMVKLFFDEQSACYRNLDNSHVYGVAPIRPPGPGAMKPTTSIPKF